MRRLSTRVHPVTVVLALGVVGLAIFMAYSRKLESQSERPKVLTDMMRPEPSPGYDQGLGAMITMSREPKGEKVVGFKPSAAASPLAMLGCFPGDVLVSVNGDTVSGANVRKAMEDLEKHGKPISLIVYRQGRKLELKHTKMPTVPAVQQLQRRPGTAMPTAPRGR